MHILSYVELLQVPQTYISYLAKRTALNCNPAPNFCWGAEVGRVVSKIQQKSDRVGPKFVAAMVCQQPLFSEYLRPQPREIFLCGEHFLPQFMKFCCVFHNLLPIMHLYQWTDKRLTAGNCFQSLFKSEGPMCFGLQLRTGIGTVLNMFA